MDSSTDAFRRGQADEQEATPTGGDHREPSFLLRKESDVLGFGVVGPGDSAAPGVPGQNPFLPLTPVGRRGLMTKLGVVTRTIRRQALSTSAGHPQVASRAPLVVGAPGR